MEYQIKLIHIPGKTNSQADMLSRRPNYDQGTKDNENVVVLPDSIFARTGHYLLHTQRSPCPKQSHAPAMDQTLQTEQGKGRMVERTLKSNHPR